MVQTLLRFYSYVFQILISGAFLAVGSVAALSDNTTFEIDFLPWTGKDLRTALLVLGALGLLSTALSFKGKLRLPFVLWTLFTVFLAGRGIFASGHRFEGASDFQWALAVLAGTLVTVAGAWSRFKQPAGR